MSIPLLSSCGILAEDAGAAGKEGSQIAAPAPEARIGYPKARWRLVPFEELNRVALWVSHIVVMHANSNPGATVLRPLSWKPDPEFPSRTEEEALSRALTIADLAGAKPERFEELAREYSDDVVTKEAGGSLGGIRAGQLPPEYLDALAAVPPGSVSRVFQTQFGFHVIHHRAPPPDRRIAGQRVVIRYEGTSGGLPGAESTRSRSEARKVADSVVALARSGERTFDDLVREYSDCVDVAQLGDLGVRSVRDPGAWPREFERLAMLKVGEVSDPMDSQIGFEILLRTSELPRAEAAAPTTALYALPDPQAPDFVAMIEFTDSSTLAEGARELVEEARRALRLEPAKIAELDRLLKALALAFEQNPDNPQARIRSWHAMHSELRAALGPEQYAEFERFLSTWTTSTIIARTP